jgi:hypothetical protein
VTRKRLILACVCVSCVLGVVAPAAWANTTSTGLSCEPSSVATNSATSCTVTVTVTDTATSDQSAPTGAVTFSASPDAGSFSDSGSCTLGTPTATSASCAIDFSPTEGGGYTLSADYGGDSTHDVSLGSTSVNAIDPTSIALRCDPSTLPINTSTTCSATLTDTDTPDAPTGEVTFTSDPDTGSFAGGDECPWSPASSGDGGTATCQITFSPSAKGNYTLSASYGGDYEHATSVGTTGVTANTALSGSGTGSSRYPGGLSLPIGSTKPTAPTPSPGKIKIASGAAKVSARHVAGVRLACSGSKGASCIGFLALSTKIKVKVKVKLSATHKHGRHPKKTQRTKTVTVTESLQLGTVLYKLQAKTTKPVSVRLSKRAFAMLAKARHHKLKATADADGIIRTITLTPAKPPPHKHKHKRKHKRHSRRGAPA